jgi:MFS family permease
MSHFPRWSGTCGQPNSQLQWIVDAYVIVFGGRLLVMGSLADRAGRKRVFLAGFSGSVGMLIAARASMGVGAAMIPSTLAIITNSFRDPGECQRAIGYS